MSRHTPPYQKLVRTIRLDDRRIAQLLDQLDATAHKEGKLRARRPRYEYRVNGVVVHIQHPGSTVASPYLVPTRNLSQGGMAFLHGGFLHQGTRCLVQLVTARKAWENVLGRVVNCKHVSGNVHMVSLRFEHEIDPALFCVDATPCSVLLVENDSTGARLATFHLQSLHAEVDHVTSGEEAIERAEAGTYDAILIDMDLPGIDGFETVRRLRERGYAGAVIAVTSLTQAGDRDRCLEAGCDQYLSKPYARKALVDAINATRDEAMYSTFQNDPSMTELVNGFVADLPERLQAIREAAAAGDAAQLHMHVRRLKADGSPHGFEDISDAARDVETSIVTGVEWKVVCKNVTALVRLCRLARAIEAQPRSDASNDTSKNGAPADDAAPVGGTRRIRQRRAAQSAPTPQR
jgi:CheY-like chemotaxis protein